MLKFSPSAGPHFLFLCGKLLANSTSCLRGDVETKAKPQATTKLKLLTNSTSANSNG